MAGRGPQPKDPSTRARRNKPQGGDFRVVEVKPAPQPALVDVLGELNPLTGDPWRSWTVAFWAELGEFPSTANHLSAQWSSLARALAFEEAALLGLTSASEGRLRIAKHGVDPDDLMRLRILTVEADEAEVKSQQRRTPKPKSGKGASDPRQVLTSVS